jgi:hypothetical protein
MRQLSTMLEWMKDNTQQSNEFCQKCILIEGNFMWSSFDVNSGVIRHELGHNYGHDHHLINTYSWRLTRGDEEHQFDGFDMMSGGNGDLAAASKWFYNWIPNESIVLMSPEGPTVGCPTCVSSVKSRILYPFDNPNMRPSSTTKMAIQIPISAVDRDGFTRAYSYWLSYRGFSADGKAAGGLSVHVGWFDLGGIFGASYDSLNYDAVGSTSTNEDSFVLPGTCYLISPSGMSLDADPASVEQVMPIACVEKVNKGKSLTVSVTFRNRTVAQTPARPVSTTRNLKCGSQGVTTGDITLDMSVGKTHLLHINTTGLNGTVDFDFCRTSELSPFVTALFYDSYVRNTLT